MSLLEKAFLIESLQAWSGSLKSRLVKAPKIFITDSGFLSYLQGLSLKRILNEPTLAGSLTENFVFCELKKQLGWSGTMAEMFHFRTSNDREIDLILENPVGELVGIEVKSGSTIDKTAFKALELLADSLLDKFKRGLILCTGNQFLSFGKDLFVLPTSVRHIQRLL